MKKRKESPAPPPPFTGQVEKEKEEPGHKEWNQEERRELELSNHGPGQEEGRDVRKGGVWTQGREWSGYEKGAVT